MPCWTCVAMPRWTCMGQNSIVLCHKDFPHTSGTPLCPLTYAFQCPQNRKLPCKAPHKASCHVQPRCMSSTSPDLYLYRVRRFSQQSVAKRQNGRRFPPLSHEAA
eukprot:362816-Chlamydomonas_euryale.AAC.4